MICSDLWRGQIMEEYRSNRYFQLLWNETKSDRCSNTKVLGNAHSPKPLAQNHRQLH